MEADDTSGTSDADPFETKQDGRCSCLKRNILLVFVAMGVAVGFGLGFGLRTVNLSADAIMWLELPGRVFMRLLMLTIIPLISSSIIVGTDVMYVSTDTKVTLESHQLQTQDMIADLIRNIAPDNIVSACFQKTQTRYVVEPVQTNNTNVTSQVYTRHIGVVNGINFLGVILISAVVGLAARTVEESSASFVPFFIATSKIFIRIMRWFIWSTPVGVPSLICVSIVRVESMEDTFRTLGMFVFYYTIGILIQQLVLIPSIYFAVIRKNPLTFLLSAFRPCLATFGAASSAMAIPEFINTCENLNNADPKVSRFVIPLGIAMCRPGSAYFIVLSCLFITTLTGAGHSAADVIIIGLLTSVSSIAIPGIPSAAVVTIIVILGAINVDTTPVGLLLALEWYTDRMRGASNALHVVTCVVIVDKFCTSGSKDKKDRCWRDVNVEKGNCDSTIL